MAAAFRNIQQQIFYYLVLSVAFLLPLFPHITGYFVGIIALDWLLSGSWREKWKQMMNHRIVFFFIAVYLMYLLGMLYSEDAYEGGKNMFLKITMFFFPLIFLAPGYFQLPSLKLILKTFLFGCLLSSLVMFVHAVYEWIITGKNIFSYSALTNILDLNPAYIAMYLGFCIFVLLLPFFHMNVPRLFASGRISIILSLFFALMILLLSARQEMIASALLGGIGMLAYFARRQKVAMGLIAAASLILIIGAIVILLPQTKMRLSKIETEFNEPYSDSTANSVTLRKVIWQSSLEIIAAHPLFGVGTGDVSTELLKKYEANRLMVPAAKNLNAHNQYLQTTLAIGLFGLFLLLLSFGAGIRLAIMYRSPLYLLFLLLFMICILTESMLEAESGVVFFAFFNALLARNALLPEPV